MSRSVWLHCFVAAIAVASATGCCAGRYSYYGDCGPAAFSGRFAPGEEEAVCSSCSNGRDDGGCGECGAAGGVADYTLTNAVRKLVSCGSGCGDAYWGEWSYDKPQDCDACGDHGEWTGVPECRYPLFTGQVLAGLRHRVGLICSSRHGCSSCGSGSARLSSPDYIYTDSDEIELEMIIEPASVPSAARAKAPISFKTAGARPGARSVWRGRLPGSAPRGSSSR